VRAASPEVREVRWFPVEALPELQHEAVSALVALARSRVPQNPLPGRIDGGIDRWVVGRAAGEVSTPAQRASG
jgi:hypothetical protein